MKIAKKLTAITMACLFAVCSMGVMTSCKPKDGSTSENPTESTNTPNESNRPEQKYDPETRPLTMSISTPDGVFSPYFSTSAYDSTITGMTQIGMLSTDHQGNIVCGDDEPTVAKDYTITQGAETTTYEFLIKNGIKYSDGEPLTIKDVLFNLYTYLDPAYTGSSTIYSTDIVGLKSYRQQQAVAGDEEAFEQQFVDEANIRIQNLIDFVKYTYPGTKEDDRPSDSWSAEEKASLTKDFATVAAKFKEELTTDWNSIDKESYKDWNFTEVWQIFMYNDGGMSELLQTTADGKLYKDENGNYKLDETEAKDFYDTSIKPYIDEHKELKAEDAVKEFCINSVFGSYFTVQGDGYDMTATSGDKITTIVKYWGTATTILDLFTAEAKSAYFAGSEKAVPNISGITTRKEKSRFNGKSLDGEYDVLTIKINGVDPKAIYNFAFTVAPMHYYSTTSWTHPKTGKTKNYIASFNGTTEFGLEFGTIEFMNEVINAKAKVGLPMGAGAYMASNATGSGKVTSDNFFNNNFVYYERNPYFETVGSGLSNAKIKYIKYKVVETDQTINALANGDIDYGDPSATQENIQAVQEAKLGHVEIMTSGYGYVGINPRFVPNINVRRAIMKAFDTELITSNYYKGGLAQIIYRPMSTTSWAYPKGVGVYKNGDLNYAFDSTGAEIEALVKDAGYTKNSQGVYEKTVEGFGKDTLNYKFTIAGASTDHPAYAMFLKAQNILNSVGFDVKVVTSQTALSDLSAGKLAVWAAAWGSTIDPDMYQVYHIDSQASSTNNWGYKQIKAGKNSTYQTEYKLVTDLSVLIDAGRATTDTEERKYIYSQALDLIMELAVEFPTYQRNDMSAFNKTVLDESTMTPADQRSPYNGLLSRIWELNYL